MESDDLFALCGVELPKPKEVTAGSKPPKAKPQRFTEWSNAHTFEFGGYVARVFRYLCNTCDNHTDILEGIFIEEVQKPSGTRRLQQMAKGANWPALPGHRKEITEVGVDLCGHCVGELGFDREVDSKGQPYTLVIPADRRKV